MKRSRLGFVIGILGLCLLLLGQSLQPTAAKAAPLAGNDDRVSQMGIDGDTLYSALDPAVAYNSTSQQFLVVWAADDNTSPVVNNDFEIYGQLIDAVSRDLTGSRFQISVAGPDGSPEYYARTPAVTYNSADNEYLVVWAASVYTTTSTVTDEFEIYGQRLSATGAEVGADDFRISNMGTDDDPAFDALNPAVAYSSGGNQYLVVWQGDDTLDGVVEIHGQLVGNDGAEVGTDFPISDMGTASTSPDFRGQDPDVAYNATTDEYLVVWEGDSDSSLLVDDEFEIFGQRVAANGVLNGSVTRISNMGSDGDPDTDADNPAVAYNTSDSEFLVVWTGSGSGEWEVYGQRLDGSGGEVGTDFAISSMGSNGDAAYTAYGAKVAHLPLRNEYLVVWRGDDNRDFGDGNLAEDEMEVFGQWLVGSTGAEEGDDDFRISDMGDSDGDPEFDADRPAVATHSASDVALVVWQGDDDIAPLVDNELEVFAEFFGSPTAITLASFTATPRAGSILVKWETATELDTLGFNLYRAQSLEDDPVQLNEELIPSQDPGGVAGGVYEYRDESVTLCEYYYYWLEDVDVNGNATRHGPVDAAMVFYRIFLPLCGE